MEFFSAQVKSSERLSDHFWRLRLAGCTALQGGRGGQFVMLRGAWGRDPILPRAYSLLAVHGGEAEFLIRRVGRGSARLCGLGPGQELAVLGPLGNGFPSPSAGARDLLVAGGCGLAPIFLQVQRAVEAGRHRQITILAGARKAEELILIDELREMGGEVSVSTEDGTMGHEGMVTDLLREALARGGAGLRIMACGPEAMLRAVRSLARGAGVRCYLSLEAPMACGVGACLGCAVAGKGRSYRYVCTEGPVFDGEEIWP